MNSKAKKDVICYNFESQTWRKNVCKNCFKTKDQHAQAPESTGNETDSAGKDASEKTKLSNVEPTQEVHPTETKDNERQGTEKGQGKKKLSSASVELKSKVSVSKNEEPPPAKIVKLSKETDKKEVKEQKGTEKVESKKKLSSASLELKSKASVSKNEEPPPPKIVKLSKDVDKKEVNIKDSSTKTGTKSLKVNLGTKTADSTVVSSSDTSIGLNKTSDTKSKSAGVLSVKSLELKKDLSKSSEIEKDSKVSSVKVKTISGKDKQIKDSSSTDSQIKKTDTAASSKSENIPKHSDLSTSDSSVDKSINQTNKLETSSTKSDASWMKSKVKSKISDDSWMKSKKPTTDTPSDKIKKTVTKKSVKSDKVSTETVTSSDKGKQKDSNKIDSGLSSLTDKCDTKESSKDKTETQNDTSNLMAWLTPKKDIAVTKEQDSSLKRSTTTKKDEIKTETKTKDIATKEDKVKAEIKKDKQDPLSKEASVKGSVSKLDSSVDKKSDKKPVNKPQEPSNKSSDKSQETGDVSALMSWLKPKKDKTTDSISDKDVKSETAPDKAKQELKEPKGKDEPKQKISKGKEVTKLKTETKSTESRSSTKTKCDEKEGDVKSKVTVSEDKSEQNDTSALLAWLAPKTDKKPVDEPVSKKTDLVSKKTEDKKDSPKKDRKKDLKAVDSKTNAEVKSEATPKKTDSKKPELKKSEDKKVKGTLGKDKVDNEASKAETKSKPDSDKGKQEQSDTSALMAWLAPKKDEQPKEDSTVKKGDLAQKKTEDNKDKDTYLKGKKKESISTDESKADSKFKTETPKKSVTASKKTDDNKDKVKTSKDEKETAVGKIESKADSKKTKPDSEKGNSNQDDTSALLAWLAPKKDEKPKEETASKKSETIPNKSEEKKAQDSPYKWKKKENITTPESKSDSKAEAISKKKVKKDDDKIGKENLEKEKTEAVTNKIETKKSTKDVEKPTQDDTSALLSWLAPKKDQTPKSDVKSKYGRDSKTNDTTLDKSEENKKKETDRKDGKAGSEKPAVKDTEKHRAKTKTDASVKPTTISQGKTSSKVESSRDKDKPTEKEVAKTTTKKSDDTKTDDKGSKSDTDAMLAWLSPKKKDAKETDTLEKKSKEIKSDKEKENTKDDKMNKDQSKAGDTSELMAWLAPKKKSKSVSSDSSDDSKKTTDTDIEKCDTKKKPVAKDSKTDKKDDTKAVSDSNKVDTKNVDKKSKVASPEQTSDTEAMLAWLTPGKKSTTEISTTDNNLDNKQVNASERVTGDLQQSKDKEAKPTDVKKKLSDKTTKEEKSKKDNEKPKSKLSGIKSKFDAPSESETKTVIKKVKKKSETTKTEEKDPVKIGDKTSSSKVETTKKDIESDQKNVDQTSRKVKPTSGSATADIKSTDKDNAIVTVPSKHTDVIDSKPSKKFGKSIQPDTDKNTAASKVVSDAAKPPVLTSDKKSGESKITQHEPKQPSAKASKDAPKDKNKVTDVKNSSEIKKPPPKTESESNELLTETEKKDIKSAASVKDKSLTKLELGSNSSSATAGKYQVPDTATVGVSSPVTDSSSSEGSAQVKNILSGSPAKQSTLSPLSPEEDDDHITKPGYFRDMLRDFEDEVKSFRKMEDGSKKDAEKSPQTPAASAEQEQVSADLSRSEAMMEANRILMDNLRNKADVFEEKCERLEKEKSSLTETLNAKKHDLNQKSGEFQIKLANLEDKCARMESENAKLLDKLKLPDAERSLMQDQQELIESFEKRIEEADNKVEDIVEENIALRHEIKDLQLEMEEMHDQFRDDEAIEFRELQKELEATAKNCRILQFKLRKSERRSEQMEQEKLQAEERLRHMESRGEGKPSVPLSDSEQSAHIRDLEEELKMAKEVSVRLHDELEMVEERRLKSEDELERVTDYLRESEGRRAALQREINTLHEEMDGLSDELEEFREMKGLPPKPSLSRQASAEAEVTQIKRDLEASLERENDLKEQLRYSEEENKIIRKKASDIEEENESLNLQLKKMSSAKSGRFKKKSDPVSSSPEPEGPDLQLQFELAEQEIKVLKRKITDMEQDNDNLLSEVKFLQHKLEDSGKPEAKPSEKPKGRGILKKSRSLDFCDTSGACPPRPLILPHPELSSLKIKIQMLQELNGNLILENKKLQENKLRSVPSIQADDAAVRNIELMDRIKALEEENGTLREKIKTLDEKTHKISREMTKTDSPEIRDLKEKLRLTEEESSVLRKKMGELEELNSKLSKDLKRQGSLKGRDKSKTETEKAETEAELKDKVVELETEIADLLLIVKSREEETERLESEIKMYQADMEQMFEAFKEREKQMTEELENMQQKNSVISTLLDLVTDRAESTQRELDKLQEGSPRSERRRSERSQSAISDVSVGSDEVFAGSPQSPPDSEKTDKEKKVVSKNWQEQFQKRIICLELLLMEERERVHAAEKKLSLQDSQLSGQQGDIQLNEREKDIIRQELELCQKELMATSEQTIQLKTKIQELSETNEKLKEEYDTLVKQMELDKSPDKKGKTAAPKEPSSWRSEKEQLEKQLKDLQKQLKFKGVTVKEKDEPTSDKDSDKWKNKCSKLEEQVTDLDNRLKELKKEKSKLHEDKNTSEKEASQKREIILEKDNIIRQKDELIKQKDSAIKDRDDSLKQRDVEFKKLNETISMMKKKENELIKLKDQVTVLEGLIQEKEIGVKALNESIRQRDGRLKEKDEILEKLNQKLNEKDSNIKELEKHTKKGKSSDDVKKLNTKLKDAEDKLQKLDKEKTKEINNLMSQREKLEKQLEKLHKEKDSLESDLKKTKDTLKTKDDKLRKERDKLEIELKQVKEKLHSMDVFKSMKSGDALKTLTNEKDSLVSEKHKLQDELNRLHKEVAENTKSWNVERDDLQNIIQDKSRLVDDNSAICEKMQMEIDRLKYQISASQLSGQTPYVTASETDHDLNNKVQLLNEQLAQARKEIAMLHTQVQNQRDLMDLSARTFQDLKARKESDSRRWEEERASFEKSLKYNDSYQKKMSDLQKEVDSVKVKLSITESRNKELETSLDAEKAARQASLVSGTKAAKSVEATAPWSQAGHAKMKWKQMEQKSGTSSEPSPDQAKTVASLQKVTKELQEKVKRLTKSKEEELKEWTRRMESYREDWDEQRLIMVERNSKLEEQVKHLSDFKKTVLELQCKLRENTERWNSEKYHLERQLNDAKRLQLLEKQRLQDMITQAHKLADVNPMLVDLQKLTKSEDTKQQIKDAMHTIEEILRQIRQGKSPEIEKYHTEVEYKPVVYTSSKFTRSLSSDTVLSQPSREIEFQHQPSRAIEVQHVATSPAPKEAPTRRARPLLRRSLTAEVTTTEETPKSTAANEGTSTNSRHSYASGTRSAFSSRDASPDKAFRSKRILNLPAPPPSFIISPSQSSPRKTFSADSKSQTGPLTSQDMAKLCNRLSEIESPDSDENQNKSSKRVLIKSASVDSSVDENVWVPMHPDRTSATNYRKQLPQFRSDSPLSQTLPITVSTEDRLHISGKNSFDRKSKMQESIEARKLSPRTVRRKFFDDYERSGSPSGYMSLPERKSKAKKAKDSKEKPLASIQIRGGKVVTVSDQSGDESPVSSPSKTSVFFSSSKEKRKLFGTKKSSSIDNSAVGSSIARMGVQVMKPAAPSTYSPPSLPEVQQKKPAIRRSSSGGDVRRSPSPFSDRSPSSPGGSVTGARPLQIAPSGTKTTTDNKGTN